MTLPDRLQDNLPAKTNLFSNLLYQLLALTIRFICFINGGLSVRGNENIPSEGGVIIASNHLSYLDPPLVGAVLPRRATFMARKGLFNIPLLSWLMKLYAVPVDREKTLPSTIKEAVMRLKNNELIVLFPEGKRSETGILQEAKRGVGMIATLSKVPVVPTLLIGTDKALPVGAKCLKRAKISVIFGKPLDFSEIEEKGDNIYENISRKIMYAIGELKKQYADNSS